MLSFVRNSGWARTGQMRLAGFAAGGLGLVATLAGAPVAPAVPQGTVTNFPGDLDNVSADSPSDAWAVGANGESPVVLHWTGTSWTPVPVPGGAHSVVAAVSALSPTDAWAVGTFPGHPAANTRVLHWNGTRWVRVPIPSSGISDSLNSVSAVSASDAWII